MKFSSLAALVVVILTTSSTASDENFIKMTIFPVSVMHGMGDFTHILQGYFNDIDAILWQEESQKFEAY